MIAYAITAPPDLADQVASIRSVFASGRTRATDWRLRQLRGIERQFDRLVGYLKATRGEVAVGGHSDRDSLTIEPTVIVDPDPDEPAMTDEIFGPILPVLEVDSVDQAIRSATGWPKPLALYVFSGSKATGRRIIDSVLAGGAGLNTVVML